MSPQVEHESAAYWRGLRDRRIVLQRCPGCGRKRFPPMPTCPYCGLAGGDEAESDGRGAVYSYVRVHRALTPAMEGQTPYSIATVQLDDGPRMLGRVDQALDVRIGDRVRPSFVDHDTWTELRFVPE